MKEVSSMSPKSPKKKLPKEVQKIMDLVQAQTSDRDLVLNMTQEELALLPDDPLLCALQTRIQAVIDDPVKSQQQPKLPALVFNVVCLFDSEIQEGGLLRFLLVYPDAAPVIASAFREMGAEAYCILYEVFCDSHGINLMDLSEFHASTVEELQALNEKYPCSDFDSGYLALCKSDPLEKHLLSYVRAHLDAF